MAAHTGIATLKMPSVFARVAKAIAAPQSAPDQRDGRRAAFTDVQVTRARQNASNESSDDANRPKITPNGRTAQSSPAMTPTFRDQSCAPMTYIRPAVAPLASAAATRPPTKA